MGTSSLFGQEKNQTQQELNFSCFCDEFQVEEGNFIDDIQMKDDDTWEPFTGTYFSAEQTVTRSVAYVRNNKLKVTAKIKSLCGNGNEAPSIKIWAEKDGAIYLPEVVANLTNNNEYIYTLTDPSLYPSLPNTIDLIDLNLVWKVEVEGQVLTVGNFVNRVYVVWDVPKVEQLTDENFPEPDVRSGNGYEHLETLFYIGCDLAKGEMEEENIVDKIWAGFKSQSIYRADGEKLHYYNQWDLTSEGGLAELEDSTIELIRDKDAQCYAWAAIFIDVFKILGLFENGELIEVKHIYQYDFLIKNWTFSEDPVSVSSAPEIFPYTNTGNTDFRAQAEIETSYPFLYNDVEDGLGVGGQGTDNPLSGFGDHMIVRLPFNGLFYDPSYGGHEPYLDNLNDSQNMNYYLYNSQIVDGNTVYETYENKVISGFYRSWQDSLNESQFDRDFNGNGSIDEEDNLFRFWTIQGNDENVGDLTFLNYGVY